jgi:CHASE1-domain containing sensor protein
MTDPVTAITASTIATLAFQEFVKSSAGELAKKFTADAIAKMNALRQKIWDKMRGKPTAEAAIASIEQGSSAELDRLVAYLQVAMDDDAAFADEIRLMAQEIHAGKIQDNSSMTQNNYDSSTGYMTKNEGGTNFVGGTHYHGTAKD